MLRLLLNNPEGHVAHSDMAPRFIAMVNLSRRFVNQKVALLHNRDVSDEHLWTCLLRAGAGSQPPLYSVSNFFAQASSDSPSLMLDIPARRATCKKLLTSAERSSPCTRPVTS